MKTLAVVALMLLASCGASASEEQTATTAAPTTSTTEATTTTVEPTTTTTTVEPTTTTTEATTTTLGATWPAALDAAYGHQLGEMCPMWVLEDEAGKLEAAEILVVPILEVLPELISKDGEIGVLDYFLAVTWFNAQCG